MNTLDTSKVGKKMRGKHLLRVTYTEEMRILKFGAPNLEVSQLYTQLVNKHDYKLHKLFIREQIIRERKAFDEYQYQQANKNLQKDIGSN